MSDAKNQDRDKMSPEFSNAGELHRVLFEEASDGIFITDPHARCVAVNPSATELTGYSREELLGMAITDLIPPKDLASDPIPMDKLRQGGIVTKERRIRRKDGSLLPVQICARMLPGGNLLGIVRDITMRKRAEESLRTRENLLSSIFRAAPIGIGVVSNRVLLAVNDRICEMIGYTQEELIGKSARILYPSDADFEYVGTEKYRQIAERGTGTVETVWQCKEGGIIDVLMSSTPINPLGLADGVMFTALDISERKSSVERIRNQLKRLAAFRAIDEAISASLDLKVTLNVVLDQIIAQLDADAADILLLNRSFKLRQVASRGFRTKALRHTSLAIGQGNAGRVAMEMRTIHIPDVGNGENSFKNAPLLNAEGFVSYYGLPLVAKGQIVGVLEIFFSSAQKLEQERLDFIETMAGHAAIAIDNAALFSGLQKSNQELTLAYDSTLEGWSRALDLRDRETEGHSERVTDMTEHIAKIMDVPENVIVHMRRGAILHDIGKMGVPDHILLKSGPLDEHETAIMQRHPVYAFEFLSPIAFLRPALEIPYCHHEKWDGSGYPRGLKGKRIPLSARIFAIVDVWDALRSDRPYRSAWSFEKTRDHILGLAGTHFDPKVVEVFKSYHTDLQ